MFKTKSFGAYNLFPKLFAGLPKIKESIYITVHPPLHSVAGVARIFDVIKILD